MSNNYNSNNMNVSQICSELDTIIHKLNNINQSCKNQEEKHSLFNAIEEIECVKKKANWALKWINDEKSSFAFLCLSIVSFIRNKDIFWAINGSE